MVSALAGTHQGQDYKVNKKWRVPLFAKIELNRQAEFLILDKIRCY